MPLVNIKDERLHPYRFRKVNAVVEATWHDNSCQNSDLVGVPELGDDGPDYQEREHISLAEAIEWANTFKNPVTLYIWDQDNGIYMVGSHFRESITDEWAR